MARWTTVDPNRRTVLSTSPWRARKTVTRMLRRKQKGTTHRARLSHQKSQPGTPHMGVHPTGVRLHGTRLPGMRPHATRLPSMRHPITRPRISRHPGISRTHASQRRNLLPRRTWATNLFPAGGVIPLTQHPLPTWGGIRKKTDMPTTHPPEVAFVTPNEGKAYTSGQQRRRWTGTGSHKSPKKRRMKTASGLPASLGNERITTWRQSLGDIGSPK